MSASFEKDEWYPGVADILLTSLILWAHIRPLDWDFVEDLSEKMQYGWTVSSTICVVELGVVQGVQQYGVVDGAHRVTSAKRLIERKFWSPTMKVPGRTFRVDTPLPDLFTNIQIYTDTHTHTPSPPRMYISAALYTLSKHYLAFFLKIPNNPW